MATSDLAALHRPLSLIGLCTRLRGGETCSSAPKFASKSADRSSRAGPYIRRGTWVEVGRYAGLGRGLTAPSWAASYHGPMPTLSTCPSRNKDGRGGCSGASAELFSWGSERRYLVGSFAPIFVTFTVAPRNFCAADFERIKRRGNRSGSGSRNISMHFRSRALCPGQRCDMATGLCLFPLERLVLKYTPSHDCIRNRGNPWRGLKSK
ncbi:hypothetical protein EAG_05404 [Camponotus floridanus]|uniref:Uncharacterized protein n=1 Tax=Camponotus floridanus TaxID=104421 RepID=E2A5Y6_CAMFO|nr:hypothetical protein EAG_05404 [Camponotus floridanus]